MIYILSSNRVGTKIRYMNLRWLVDRRIDIRVTLDLNEVEYCGAENDFFKIAIITSFLNEISRRY